MIANKTGYLQINATETEVGININPNAAVRLYYDNNNRLNTTIYGVEIVGTTDTDGLVVSGVTTTNQLKFADSNGSSTNIALFGDNNDLKISNYYKTYIKSGEPYMTFCGT